MSAFLISHPGAEVGPSGMAEMPFKVVRELGLERRETKRSLFAVGAGELRWGYPSTRVNRSGRITGVRVVMPMV